MAILRRRSLIFLACCWMLLCILLNLLAPAPVKADVGVHPILPGGSDLKPDKTTPIRMAAEVITMNVRLATATDNTAIQLNPEAYGYQNDPIWFQAVAEVQADFTMKNPTSESISMTVWFPLASVLKSAAWYEFNPDEIVPRINSFMVKVDGAPLDYAVSELPNPAGADKPNLPWASFPVTFPADQETMLHVSYVLSLLPLPKSNALALYYIFQTGAGWAGPIGQAELIINLPYPASTETLAGMPPNSMNPPYFIFRGDGYADLPRGVVLAGNQAHWTWKNLEPGPKDDFSILLIHPKSWESLQSARSAVEINPEDGKAWWNLCTTYYFGSRRMPGIILPAYTQNYLSLGVEACQNAAQFLPLDAAPHYVLAAFYMDALAKNPSLNTLQPVLIELKLGQQLEAKQPPSKVYLCDIWEEGSNSDCLERDVASTYKRTPNPTWYSKISDNINSTADNIFSNATAEIAVKTANAKATLTARPSATASPTRTPTRTPTPSPTLTSFQSPTFTPSSTSTLTPMPSATLTLSNSPQPSPTSPPIIEEKKSSGQSAIPFVVAGAIGLIVIGYLTAKVLRKRREM